MVSTIQPTARASDRHAEGSASARPRRVLFLVDSLLSFGGAEGALLKMVRQLPQHGYECSIAAFELSTDPAFTNLFPCPLYPFPIANVYGPNALRTAWRLRQLVDRHRFDVIHTMFPVSDLWGGPIARFGSKAALVSGRRDMGIVRSAKHEWAYRLFGGMFDQVQAVSEAARLACMERDGLAPERVVTVHNGVDVDEIDSIVARQDLRQAFGLERPGPTVITVAGTIAPVKGIDVLLEAAALVCRQMPETNFLILGWSDNAYVRRTPALLEYNRQLAPRAEALGIAANVKLRGWIPDVVAAMKACDVFCQPSRSEGLSNALLEAMASGLPSVATDVGGNPEVLIPEETGYLVPAENPQALATRLLELLGNPALRSRMGAAARKRVRASFSLDAMAARVAQSYEAAIRQRQGS